MGQGKYTERSISDRALTETVGFRPQLIGKKRRRERKNEKTATAVTAAATRQRFVDLKWRENYSEGTTAAATAAVHRTDGIPLRVFNLLRVLLLNFITGSSLRSSRSVNRESREEAWIPFSKSIATDMTTEVFYNLISETIENTSNIRL